MGRRRLALIVLAAAVALGGACSPPKAPLEIGVRDVRTDVVIGTRQQDPAPTASTTTTTSTVPPGPEVQPVTGITVSGSTTTSP